MTADEVLPWWNSPQRFFLNAPKQPDGTCFVLNSDYVKAGNEIKRLQNVLRGLASCATCSACQVAAQSALDVTPTTTEEKS